MVIGCFPERTLSSYMNGAQSNSGIVTGPNSRADAGPSVPDGGVVGDGGVSALLDAAAPPSETDAGPAPRLACRGDCVCEPRGALEFMFCAAPVTRAVAVERCGQAGGGLVSVADEEQNSWLSARMLALEADDFWLSGTDVETEGIWRWDDGRVFYGADAGVGRFAPWDEGQPNDVNGEDCMRATEGVWRDLDCAEEIAYVCQG
jgi:hypothetical protein